MKIITTVLFCAVLCYTVVHNHMHTDMSSSYRWTVLGLDFVCIFSVFTMVSLFVLELVILCLVWSSVPVQLIAWKDLPVSVWSGTLNHTHSLTQHTKWTHSCVGQVVMCSRFLKKPSPVVFWVLLGTGFYWFFGGVLKYEWQLLNVIHIK